MQSGASGSAGHGYSIGQSWPRTIDHSRLADTCLTYEAPGLTSTAWNGLPENDLEMTCLETTTVLLKHPRSS